MRDKLGLETWLIIYVCAVEIPNTTFETFQFFAIENLHESGVIFGKKCFQYPHKHLFKLQIVF